MNRRIASSAAPKFFNRNEAFSYDEILYLILIAYINLHTSAPPLLVVPGRDGFHSSRILPLALFVVHGACLLRRDVQDVRLHHLWRQWGPASTSSKQVFFRPYQRGILHETEIDKGGSRIVLPQKIMVSFTLLRIFFREFQVPNVFLPRYSCNAVSHLEFAKSSSSNYRRS